MKKIVFLTLLALVWVSSLVVVLASSPGEALPPGPVIEADECAGCTREECKDKDNCIFSNGKCRKFQAVIEEIRRFGRPLSEEDFRPPR